MRVALDTNILAYAEGVNGAKMRATALDLIQKLSPDLTILPVQTLGELFNVLVRKAGQTRAHARDVIMNWQDAFSLVDTSATVMLSAAELATAHHVSIWDAVIVASAAEARCRLLLSEDLQDGFTWAGLTVANPFLSSRHPLLDALLENGHLV